MPSQSPPPKARSRSGSPPKDDSRRRSRSPPRGPRTKNFSGLKWKDSGRRNEERDDRDRGDRRGFRDDDRRRDDRFSGGGGGRDRRDYDSPNTGQGRIRERNQGRDDDRGDRKRDARREAMRRNDERDARESKEKGASSAAPAAAPGQQMIIVTVNDRLGTKAQIPCMASDPVKVFKAMVAARIGRPAHEIMLKRQGERPFKDQLTLEDYGVSNGVQIDLELDTGD